MAEAPAATTTAPAPAAPAPAPASPANLVADAGKQPENPIDHIDPPKTEEAKTDAPAEIEYKFELPEGVKFGDDEASQAKLTKFNEQVTAFAKEQGLSAEQAQAAYAQYVKGIQESVNANTQLWYDTQKQWQDAVRADKEIGGEALDRNLGMVAKAIDEIAGEQADEVRQAFSFTGAGNNPAIVKFLVRAANMLTEGAPVKGNGPINVGSAVKSMYPSAN